MEGWAEIWDLPEVVFPLRMARTREEFERLAVFDFQVEVRGPDSTKVEDGGIELCDDTHEIYFHPKQAGLHQVRIKVDDEDFCPPIHLLVQEDGSVKPAKRQQPPKGRLRQDNEQNKENDRKPPSVESKASGEEDALGRHRSSSFQSNTSDNFQPDQSEYRSRSSSRTEPPHYISGPNGELFVETDGRLVLVSESSRSPPEMGFSILGSRRQPQAQRGPLIGSDKQWERTASKSSEKPGMHSCSLCNKLVKLKRLLLLEGVPYCEPCFKQLFMRKGPQQHLEALQPREPREIGLGRRDSKFLQRYSQHPRANLTGLKMKDFKYAQTEFVKFDAYSTGKADRRFLDPLLRVCLSRRLSERKTNAAMADRNTRQAIIRCGLNGPGEMTSLEFLNILAFAIRERTTSWLADSTKTKSKMNMKWTSLSAPDLRDLTHFPTDTPSHRDIGGTESKKSAARMVNTLETIPSADALDSESEGTQPSKAEESQPHEIVLPLANLIATGPPPPETILPLANLIATGTPPPETILPLANLIATGPPPSKEEREFGVTHGESDAWMMY